jgi:FkbM family methyltransferase
VHAWARAWSSRGAGRKPVIFDVGANEGDFTAVMLAACGDCEIHCFEPNPATAARLAKRFAGDPRVKINACGLADVPGELMLYDRAGTQGSEHASFLKDTFEDVYKSATQAVTVPIDTIDGYLARSGITALDFLKVDVEGFEKAVLTGAAASLAARRIDTIQLEFNAHNILSGLSILTLSKMLSGYELFRILSDGLTPVTGAAHLYNSRVEIFKYANLVAVLPNAVLRS